MWFVIIPVLVAVTGVVVIWFLSTVIVDYLFISSSSLKSIKIKDVEVTIGEINEIKYYEDEHRKLNDTLAEVIELRSMMTEFIDKFFDQTEELDVIQGYKTVIDHYRECRKGKRLYWYSDASGSYEKIGRLLKLPTEKMGSVVYTVDLMGRCIVDVGKSEKSMLFVVRTKYTESDYIAVISGDWVIDQDYLMIIDCINYYETMIAVQLALLSV